MPDPALAADTCIEIDPGNPQWLSPAIVLNSGANLDKASPGNNTVQVTFKHNTNCTLPPNTDAVLIELWVADPSIAFTPTVASKLIANTGALLPSPGASHTEAITWVLAAGAPSPEDPGHKCLVARCYPDPLTPSSTNFYVDDQHVAQRNIAICPCPRERGSRQAAAAADTGPECGFMVQTANVNEKEPEVVTVASWFDAQPTDYVRGVVMEHMRHIPYFKRLATAPPAGFKHTFPELGDAEIVSGPRRGCLGQLFGGGKAAAPPAYEVRARLEPGQLTPVRFAADVSRADPGDAFIFHLQQRGPGGRHQGGLTLVMVAA